MIKTLIGGIVLLGVAGLTAAAPPQVAPAGQKAAAPAQGVSASPVAREPQPGGSTWFGMGFESRQARLGIDGSAAAHRGVGSGAPSSRATNSPITPQANPSFPETDPSSESPVPARQRFGVSPFGDGQPAAPARH